MGGGGGVRVVEEAGCGDGGGLPMQLVVSEGRGSEGFLLMAVLRGVSRQLLLLLVLVGGAGVRGGGQAGCGGGDLIRQPYVSVGGGGMQPTPSSWIV